MEVDCAIHVQAAGLATSQSFKLVLQSNGLEVDVSWDQAEALAKDVINSELTKCTRSDQHLALLSLARIAAAKCNFMQAKARSGTCSILDHQHSTFLCEPDRCYTQVQVCCCRC